MGSTTQAEVADLDGPLVASVGSLRAHDPMARIVVVTPGEAATQQVQSSIARAGVNGVRVCSPDALIPALLPIGSELAAVRPRTPGYWQGVVSEVHPTWSTARRVHHALELFEADLGDAAADNIAPDLARGRTPDTIALIDALAPQPAAVLLYGFATEDRPVDLPTPLDVLVPRLTDAGIQVAEVKPRPPATSGRRQTLFLAPDRLSEVVAVTEAIDRSAARDVAVVVPDEGAYESAVVSRLEARGIATRTGRVHRLAETVAGRWLRTFLLAADDRFARPLLIDLLEQVAAGGALAVDDVIELDRVSRREWVLDQRHWRALADNERLSPAVRDAVGVLLDAAVALSNDDPLPIERMLQLIAPLAGARELRRAARTDAVMSNRLRLRRMLGEQLAPRDVEGVAIHRLSEAFGLTETTVYVLGLDTTATYRSSQSAAEISRFKAKRRSWVWMTQFTPQLIVSAPTADLASGDRLEVSAWVRDLDTEPSELPAATVLRSALPGTTATPNQFEWVHTPPERRIGTSLADHRWSPSQIDTFQRCPLQWMLKYVLRLPTLAAPESDEAFDPKTRGTVVHRVLEDHAASGMQRSFEELLREALRDELTENALRDGDPLLEIMISDLARRIETGHREIEAELALSGDVVDERGKREVEAAVMCGDRPVRFRGKIDRLIDGPGGRTILDYKSSRRATGVGDLSSAAASGENLQLWLYSLMLAGDAGAPMGDHHLALAFPLAEIRGRQRRVSKVPLKEADHRLAKVAAGVGRLIESAEAEPLAVPASGWNSPCRWCEVADACPERHRDGPVHDPRRQFMGRP